MAKLLINSSGSNKITLSKQSIKELRWTEETKLDIKRVGNKLIIKELNNEN